MKTTTKLVKIGNSKGVILPSIVIKTLALEEGDKVLLTYNDHHQTLTLHFPTRKQLRLLQS